LPVHVDLNMGWAPEAVWMLLIRENYVASGKVHDAVYHILQSTDET